MSTVDLEDLRRRVEENVAALYAGEVLPHQFTEEESLALRPKGHGGFGVQPDGRIRHCGTALMGRTDLDIALWNDAMRIRAGFPIKNTSEEFRARVRADIPRRRKEHEEYIARMERSLTRGSIMSSGGPQSRLYGLILLVVTVVLVVGWLYFQR